MAQSIRRDGKTGQELAEMFLHKYTREGRANPNLRVNTPQGAGMQTAAQPGRIRQEWKKTYSFPSKKS